MKFYEYRIYRNGTFLKTVYSSQKRDYYVRLFAANKGGEITVERKELK
jgi:hypothetical protein